MPKAAELGVASVEDAVRTLLGIEYQRVGPELKILCPSHDERNPSCGINEETGYWHCFSCGVGGDFADLVAVVLEKERGEALDLLSPGSIEAIITSVRSKLESIRRRDAALRAEEPPVPQGPYEDGPLTYLRGRGFTNDTIARWGVRFVPEQALEGHQGLFVLRSSVGIPIRDHNRRLLAWCYRRTPSSPGWQPRYLYSNEVAGLWFGMEHHYRAEHVTIVEGALDAMWLDQCGFPALGLLGSGMAGGKRVRHSKVMRLQHFKSLTLLGDRDAGGLAWVQNIGEALCERMPVRVATYSSWMDAKDPQDLPGVDLELVHERAQPYLRWRRRHVA